MRKKAIVIAVTVLVIYVGVYAILSVAGEYYVGRSGKVRYSFGISFPDLEMFHPKWAWFQPGFIDVKGEKLTRGNMLGYVFSPLITLDRKFIHKTVVLIESPENVAGDDSSLRAGSEDE